MLTLLYSEKNTAFSSIPTKRIIMIKWRLQCNSIKPKSSRFFFFLKCLHCRIILRSYVHENSDRSELKHHPCVARTNPTQCTVCIKYNEVCLFIWFLWVKIVDFTAAIVYKIIVSCLFRFQLRESDDIAAFKRNVLILI